MGISALMADRSGRLFAFENGERVECFDDCASLRRIDRERYHTLTDGVLRDFDTTSPFPGLLTTPKLRR
jgi:hypothetical protein